MILENPDLILPGEVNTLSELFYERVRRNPRSPAYRYFDAASSEWRDLSWADIAAEVERWRAALSGEGLASGERIAVMLPNGVEWVCVDQAAMSLGLVVVPLFVNDRPDNVAYILHETGARLLLLDQPERWDALRLVLAGSDSLQRIVVREDGAVNDPRVKTLRQWLDAATGHAPEPAGRGGSRDDLAAIVYTSGTAGRAKGVMLTHGNILWNAHASYCSNPVSAADTFLSFLPLSHTLERTVGYYLPMMANARVAFARSVAQLGEDLATVRPTALISVPRIYERIHDRIQTQMEGRSALARGLFRRAVDTGWARFQFLRGRAAWSPALLLWPLLRRLVAGKVLARLGGRIRLAVCGGAPLPEEVARTFIGLGLPLIQGYGMTEASPVLSGNCVDDNDPASVGRPLRDVEIKVTEQGELLARSPGVMLGYLNDPAATTAAIDAEGWLHTGDKGKIENGFIYITGRLKDIIVLSNGEKVSPADMEMALASDPLFEQVLVVGEGRPCLSALLVLNRERWSVLARQLDMPQDDPRALQSPIVVREVGRRIEGLTRKFPGYARIRRFSLSLDPWTVENGMQTPTLKLRRQRIAEQAGAVIDRLYAGR
ncbi:MAG: long-chain fatty acid--CoA ligase [Gammaproteobacteria bacterium]|nr:long-chain fatty acid--CoA ligase [Gammaproteobacteria bacterium]